MSISDRLDRLGDHAATSKRRSTMVNEWTRGDLPDIGVCQSAGLGYGSNDYAAANVVLDSVVEWLDEHHPKPEAPEQLVRMCNEADLKRTQAEADRDHWRRAHAIVDQERDQARLERDEEKEWRTLFQRDVHEWRTRAEAAEKRHQWPKTTPTGHTYIAPDTYAALCHQHSNAAQAEVESWDADECPPEPTWEMVGIAHREVERLQRDLDEWKARAEKAERSDSAADRLIKGAQGEMMRQKARAEKAERELSKVESRAAEWSIAAGKWQDRAQLAEADLAQSVEDTWAAEDALKNRTAVTRAEVEKAIRAEFHDEGFDHKSPVEYAVIRVVCDLFGVEAEATVDPVEELARTFADVAQGPGGWRASSDAQRESFRRLAVTYFRDQEARDGR